MALYHWSLLHVDHKPKCELNSDSGLVQKAIAGNEAGGGKLRTSS